jgi:DNA-binding NarL/FixJ family response regulator
VTRNERIMRMWKQDGMSYADIARELKLTRSTVAGVVWRSGYRLDIVDRLIRQSEGRKAGHKRGDRNG